MRFKAYKDNVFILPEMAARETASGIALPDSAINSQYGNKILCGRVIDAGPGGTDESGQHWPVQVTVGERVLFPYDAGEVVVIGEDIPQSLASSLEPGTEVRVLRNNEIAAVLG